MTFRGFGVGVSMLVVERPFLPLQVRPEKIRWSKQWGWEVSS